MTAHSLIATRAARNDGNVKDRVSQPQRTFIDFTQFGFTRTDWNQYAYNYLGIVFHLAPSIAGLKATSKALGDGEIFAFGTWPDVIAERLKELACDLLLAQGEVEAPLDADWLTETLPNTEATPERYGLAGEV